ncbi:MAG: hypothetical protein KGI27_06140 [Thaumarchaeota archaeon]|nr:hypothetical protein [Nitrososphaerota archaeon]
MKILLFSIFPLIMILVFTAQDAKAMPYTSPQDLYKQSDIVIYGQVTAKENGPGPDYYNYQVKVLTYFKNPQIADSITLAAHKPDNMTGLMSYPQFEVGDKAIFYVNNLDGINTISPYSVKAGGACNINSFLGSNGVPSHLIKGPVPGNHIYIEDANGNMPYRPLTFHTVVFHDDDVWNNYPEPRLVPVTLSIINEGGGQQVFNQTQNVEISACSGPGKVQWNFVPTQISNYVATVTDYKYKVSMGFNTVSDSTNSIFPSPLEQTRLGVQPDNVNCSDGLWLLIKAEDGSPACVGPSTAKKLVERGWARQGTYYRDIHVQPEITLNDYNYPGIDQDSNTTVSINNQTYYQTTLNYSAYKLPTATPIQFHNVTFTFPAGTFLTPGGAIIMLDIRFPDGYAEAYGNHTANGGSGILVPTPYGPHTAVNSTTILSNHGRPQAGMTIYHDKIRLLVSTEGQSAFVSIPTVTSPPTLCDTPYNPKENVITPLSPNGTHTITEYTPIFFMPMNSTGKICVQYSNGNQPAHVGIRIFEADNLGKDSDTVTASASKDIIPTGNSTVVYTINSGNKVGFYGVSLFCGGQGLAIGYDNNSRIVLDDFPWYGRAFSCPALRYNFEITGLSNIGVYYITKTTREDIGYNITGVSVSSVHPTSTSQTVTFSFNVRTYNSGAHLWYDYKDSTLSKYFGDPGLKEESNPCTWDITNPYSLDNAQEFQFIGNAVVNDNPVTIPPYSNGTYAFSIIAKGLGTGIYRLNPVIYSESTDSKIPQDRLGGAAVAQNYPLTIGLDSNMNPSGICRW